MNSPAKYRYEYLLCWIIILTGTTLFAGTSDTTLHLKKTIHGNLSPKSVVCNGKGIFFAQNMMYRHTIHVYNSEYKLIKVISDKIRLDDFGYSGFEGEQLGAPVECAFSHKGEYAWVSNYTMTGKGFENPGCDGCSGTDYDPGFVYRINTSTLEIEDVVKVGSVPKFLCATPDDNYLLVSNWSSADISVISLGKNEEIKKIHVGRFPRGIAVDSKSRYAYVAIMGGTSIMKIDLSTFSAEKFADPGRGPRHLSIDSRNYYLYATLNNEGNLARINLSNGKTDKLFVGGTPRSMTMSSDDRFIYLVNYSSAKITKIQTSDFTIVETASTGANPIGITYSEENGEVWVACYSGSLMIYEDKEALIEKPALSEYAAMIPALSDFYSSAVKILTPPPGISSEAVLSREANPEIEKSGNNEEPSTVSQEILKKNSVPDKVIPPKSSAGSYYVIVGSFKNKDNAVRKQNDMISRGYPCEMITRSNGFHSVAVGSYLEKEEAEEVQDTIRSRENMDSWVWVKE